MNMKTECCYALVHAALKGHHAIVRTLLDHGAGVNACEGEYGSAIQAAAYGCHEDVVRLLLENEAVDVDMREGGHGSAIEVAARKGYEGIVRLLLGPKARLGMSLQLASSEGHHGIVELLMETCTAMNTGELGALPATPYMRSGHDYNGEQQMPLPPATAGGTSLVTTSELS